MCSKINNLRLISSKLSQISSSKCRLISTSNRHCVATTFTRLKTFEPDYLDANRHLPDMYPPINVQMKGHNFDILESYQRYVHNLAENMGIDVNDSWATPCTTLLAKTYEESSTNVKDSYEINIYERNVQVTNMRTIDAPIFVDILRRTIPEGVGLSVHEDADEHFEARFIPDPFINGLKSELKEMEDKRALEMEDKAEAKVAKDAAKEKSKLDDLYASLE